MSTINFLRAFVNQRLTVVVEEIIGMFSKTITEYEEEIDRQRRLLGAEQVPGIKITLTTQTGESQVIQPLTVSAKVPSEQQDSSPSLHQDSGETLCIKEEPEDVWESEVEEQFQGPEEAEITFPSISVKSEDDEEKPQSSQLHQRPMEERTETDRAASRPAGQIKARVVGGDCEVLEPVTDLDVAGFLKATSDGQFFLSQCFKMETEVLNDDWNQLTKSQPSSNTLKYHQTTAHERSLCQDDLYKCPACSKTFKHNTALQRHITCHTGEKPFDCTECGKTFRQKGGLHIHMRKHTGEKPFGCPVCGKNFTQSGTLAVHVRIHTGEKPFTCSVCKKRYSERGTLVRHMRVHTGEKPFTCSLCGKSFSEKGNLNKHMRIHTGEKPFSCSECEKKFSFLSHLKNHKCPHTKSIEAVQQALQRECAKGMVQLTRCML
uniref:C2H2-type domain-containing protein n=1 Tax=Monopterus albus TaxID=43700 RepID=A0A3Q3J1R5_MONAL|nr:zinc finger protein 32-like [Monopterus albus]